MGYKDWYNNLAYPTNVRQNLWTLTLSWRLCVFIESIVISKWASASSGFPGFPEKSGLKCDQFKCTICFACFVGCYTCGVGFGWAGGGGDDVISGACGPA